MKWTIGKWLSLPCLLALCIACSAPSSTSETQMAIQQFYDSLAAEDYAAVLGMYSEEIRQALPTASGEVDQGYIDWAQAETKQGRVERIELVDEQVDETTATVKYRVIYEDGSSADRSVSLTKEAGSWKLGYIDEA
jgi:hypothetical protein